MLVLCVFGVICFVLRWVMLFGGIVLVVWLLLCVSCIVCMVGVGVT